MRQLHSLFSISFSLTLLSVGCSNFEGGAGSGPANGGEQTLDAVASDEPETESPEDSETKQEPQIEKISIRQNRDIESGYQLAFYVEATLDNGKSKKISKSLEWKSSDDLVATVDESGRVKSGRAGTTKIEVSYKNYSTAINLNVPETDLMLSRTSAIEDGDE